MAAIRHNGEMAVSVTSSPAYAGQSLRLELHDRLPTLLRNRKFVLPQGVADVKVEQLPEQEAAG